MIFAWVAPHASYLPGEDPGGKEVAPLPKPELRIFYTFKENILNLFGI